MADYLKELIEKAKKQKKEEAKEEVTEFAERKKEEKETGTKTPRENAEQKMERILEEAKKEVQEKQLPKEIEAKMELVKTIEAREEAEKKTKFEEEMEKTKKTLLYQKGDTYIYKVEGQQMLYYHVPVARPTSSEKAIINTLKEAATRLITFSPYRIRDPEQRRTIYHQQIMDILKTTPELGIPAHRFDFYANAVVKEMVGYGIIDELVKDDNLEEIMVISPKTPVYVFHRELEMMTTNIEFYSDDEITDLINKIAREVGRRIDFSSPLLDARLVDGSRVNATIPPASVSGATLTIRKFRKDPYSIIDLIKNNTFTIETAAFMWLAVEGMGAKPANILISGGTGSGKTTTLNVLASFIPTRERIVSIEDTSELNLPLKHWIRLEARPPGREGTGEITLDILTKNSLRMRPDRIIVGEIRHEEAFTLFTALNTGHDGCLGTVHANSSRETIIRVTSPPMSVPEIMLTGLDLIMVQHRIHDREKGTIRRITEISEVIGVLEGKAQIQTLFERETFEDTIRRTTIPSNLLNTIEKATGMTRKEIELELKKREKVLKEIMDKGIRDMAEVNKIMEKYILEQSEQKKIAKKI